MAIVTINDLSIGFRGPPLLDGVSCQIEPRQRIGLLGRNGAGKTTFMRILCGEVEADSGELQFAPLVKMSLLPQDVPQDITGSVFDVVAQGFQAAIQPEGRQDDPPWKKQLNVEQILSRMLLDGQDQFEVLSSGMKR